MNGFENVDVNFVVISFKFILEILLFRSWIFLEFLKGLIGLIYGLYEISG